MRRASHGIKNPSPREVMYIFSLYGTPGDPIPNSKYKRGYCRRCWEPIRTTGRPEGLCYDCGGPISPASRGHLTERQRVTAKAMMLET